MLPALAPLLPCYKDRGHQRNIWQMVAALVGVVDDDDVARSEWCAVLDGGLHGGGHGPQMDGNVGGLGQ